MLIVTICLFKGENTRYYTKDFEKVICRAGVLGADFDSVVQFFGFGRYADYLGRDVFGYARYFDRF